MKLKIFRALSTALLTLPLVLKAQTTVFNDSFSSSTLNSDSPAAPTATSTSYQLMSAKSWVPTPGIRTGDLKFGIAATSSGTIEVQALFTTSPITLLTNGDTVSLQISFTNSTGTNVSGMSGILSTNGELGIGLYNSGGVGPIAGGLNGTAITNDSNAATGGAQDWAGYDSNMGFTNGVGGTGKSSQISDRAPQTGADNNNQELILAGAAGSTSQEYANPTGSTVASQSFTPSTMLSPNAVYTELFSISLVTAGQLGVTNSLYSGEGTSGALLSTQGGQTTTSYYLTNSFDALAIGWHTSSQSSAGEMDIINIKVFDSLAGGSGLANAPTPLDYSVVGGTLMLSWAADHLGWTLQAQTNATGVNGAWTDVPGSTGVTQENFPINHGNVPVFFRLSESP